MNKNNIYIQIFAWKKISDDIAIRYAILMCVDLGKYAVQSADFFNKEDEVRVDMFDQQFVELFMEPNSLDLRHWRDSVSAAIQAHDTEFSN